MNAVDHKVLADNIQSSLEEGTTPDEPCPIISEGINLCALVESIRQSKNLLQSQIGSIETKKLKKALETLGIDNFEGGKATKKKMAQIMEQYVDEKCGCSAMQ